MPYVHVVTGKEYTGRVPREVSSVIGEERGNIYITKRVTAKVGDPEYVKVLGLWLLERGYIRAT